jgi:hypothetical protein
MITNGKTSGYDDAMPGGNPLSWGGKWGGTVFAVGLAMRFAVRLSGPVKGGRR